MAKRRRPARGPLPVGHYIPDETPGNGADPAVVELDPAVEALIRRVATCTTGDWGIFTTGKPVTAQAKKPDGTYRTVPLDGTEEFTFAGIRMGKRGKMIFEFRPIDPTYALIEFDETKVFEALPDLEPKIMVGISGVEFADMEQFDKPGDGYAMTVSAFKAKFRKAVVAEVKAVEAEKIKTNEDRMAENPMYGMF